MRYTVHITERISHIFSVNAENKKQAREIATKAYYEENSDERVLEYWEESQGMNGSVPEVWPEPVTIGTDQAVCYSCMKDTEGKWYFFVNDASVVCATCYREDDK